MGKGKPSVEAQVAVTRRKLRGVVAELTVLDYDIELRAQVDVERARRALSAARAKLRRLKQRRATLRARVKQYDKNLGELQRLAKKQSTPGPG